MLRLLVLGAFCVFDAFPGCASARPAPTHTVVGIDPPLESIPSAVVRVRWTNPGRRDVRLTAYRLEWPGGAMDVRPAQNAVIPAGGTIVRTTRVELRDGALPVDPATVHVVGVEVI